MGSEMCIRDSRPIGDDSQLMSGGSGGSGGRSVLWFSTHAVQLAVPIGDDSQLMSGASGASGGRPVLWLSTHAVHFCLRLRRALFHSSFAFLFSVQTFPFLCRSTFLLFRLFRSYFVPLFRSSFRSSIFRRWGFPKHR